jgi:N-acetylglucosaminyldiphosphoundecaprenol N-acetyl-beta-D-mannosaminyltransferase
MSSLTESTPTALRVLGVKLHAVSMDQAVERVLALIQRPGFHLVVTLGTEMVMRAQDDPEFRELVNGADLVVADGAGLLWAARRCGLNLPERVAGIDLVCRLAETLAGSQGSLFLLGAAPGVAEEAARALCNRYPGLQIAGSQDGFFQEDGPVVQAIAASGTRLLLTGLGSPRQERWMRQHQDRLGVGVGIGVGGSFDVLSGRKTRAPGWMIRLHLEWLFRLACEPSRLLRMMALPRFMVRVLGSRGQAVTLWNEPLRPDPP